MGISGPERSGARLLQVDSRFVFMFSFIAETKMIATRSVVGPECGEAGHVFPNFISSCIGYYSALNSKSNSLPY